jgi:predicted DNA-binding transcriptional regulator YafY
MTQHEGKTDRQARLVKIEHLICQNRKTGLSIAEMAKITGMSGRTIRRDLDALQNEFKMPIWERRDSAGIRFGVDEGYVLPPVDFTLPEAMALFMSARLMLSYAQRYDPNIASVFIKLNSIVTPPLKTQIEKTLEWMSKLPPNEKIVRALAVLSEGWVSRRQVKIRYHSLSSQEARERIIDPYFIQPMAPSHSTYVIAYCHTEKTVRTFKLERIKEIQLGSENYSIPAAFDANEYLSSGWGIVVGKGTTAIKLKFNQETARLAEETIWHPTQSVKKLQDGSIEVSLKVIISDELISWILGWGPQVEVLNPSELRQAIITRATATAKIYN